MESAFRQASPITLQGLLGNDSGASTSKKIKKWTVAIDSPVQESSERQYMEYITLENKAMATSGNYRKFRIDPETGDHYVHILNPKTGYPMKNNVLSVSVIADNCMKADAYATAFKTMGLEKVKSFLEKHPELKVFLIFENENGELDTLAINGFPES